MVIIQPTSARALEGVFKVLICPRNSQVGASEPEELGVKGIWMTSTLLDEEAVAIIVGNNNMDDHNQC